MVLARDYATQYKLCGFHYICSAQPFRNAYQYYWQNIKENNNALGRDGDPLLIVLKLAYSLGDAYRWKYVQKHDGQLK